MIIISSGKNIKLHRIKKGWTQEDLATGLISVSYLSKIENEHLTASPDIIEELCLKLGIPNTTVNEIELNVGIQSWYQKIVERDLTQSIEMYNELFTLIKENCSFYTSTFFSIISIRYFLMIGRLDVAKDVINELATFEKEFSNDLLFYYHKFKGTYEYLNNNFEKAYQSYKQTESLIDSTIDTFERADVFYSIGLITTKLLKPYLAVYYTNQALELFRSHYILNKCSECHLLLGISFQSLKEYDEALAHYQWANKLAKEVNYHSLLGIIEHNIGFTYYIQGQDTTALKHYERSLEIKENTSSKLNTIICIIKILYKQSNIEKLQNWLATVQTDLPNISLTNKELFHEYKIFNYLSLGEEANFIYYTSKIAIPYFEKNSSYINLSYYSSLLAEYFKAQRKYKQSSFYFEYCKEVLNKNIYNY